MTEQKKKLEYIIKRIDNDRIGNDIMSIESMANTPENVVSTGIDGLDNALGVAVSRKEA